MHIDIYCYFVYEDHSCKLFKDILEDSSHFFIISPHAAGGDMGDWLDRRATCRSVGLPEELSCISTILGLSEVVLFLHVFLCSAMW